ncbi:MAG: FAD-dependent thymidylate synthase [Epsilonproteobacteria bacterium]|nr:MAG: FAD-dependent thymidylate synthase [Campylobacterota bacterium]
MKNTIEVLDHGFVKLRNLSGPVRRVKDAPNMLSSKFDTRDFDADDIDPAITARISFDNLDEVRSKEQDIKLVEYLIKNRHCFYESMQVLTTSGWAYWKDLKSQTQLVIPNPETYNVQYETLDIKSWEVTEEELSCFTSKQMEYIVTKEHNLWVKGKYEKEFTKQKANEVTNWGSHEHSSNYSLVDDATKSCKFALLGFFLGDGSYSSQHKVAFHLKKQRKIDYLCECLETLGIDYSIKAKEYSKTSLISFEAPSYFYNFSKTTFASKEKDFYIDKVVDLSEGEVASLLEGLIESDGHRNKAKNRIEFSTTQNSIGNLFELLSSLYGYQVHRVAHREGLLMFHARGFPQPLARKKQYLATKKYTGKVYCATSSTGLLIVRGSPTSNSFICGNSTPMEMVEVWMEMKLPIFVARQFVRHRTATINEVSARYAILPDDWYIPELDVIGCKATSNKQGRDIKKLIECHPEDIQIMKDFRDTLNTRCLEAHTDYIDYIEKGIAPEVARSLLHLNHYTHWVWKQDLSNLMHFLSLRLHEHAQYEARVYAQAIYDLLQQYLPETMRLFDEYKRL